MAARSPTWPPGRSSRWFPGILGATLGAVLVSTEVWAQIFPPPPGRPVPDSYRDMIARDPTAFQFQRAWIRQAERVRANLRALEMEQPPPTAEIVVSGVRSVPVLAGKFINTGADPFSPAQLQGQLFSGPNPTGTVTQLYTAISGGLLTLTGTVHGTQAGGLIRVSQPDFHYEGNPGCQGLNPGCGAKLGDYMKEVLDSSDVYVDFRLHDSDGPDGVPNSGDDDGFVDITAFVHPERDGACFFGTNIWSHRWTYSAWKGAPYTTNDAAAGGGFIKVNDYSIQPLVACNGTSLIQIGVFAHEFGHGFGLPDLYDRDFTSAGVGRWCLMGYGAYGGDGLHPETPTHMSAWAKARLGWVTPTLILEDQNGRVLQPVETSGQVLKVYPKGSVSTEYFLIEHRVRTGNDQWLPADGVAIWHVDENWINNDNEVLKLVDLEEADGLAQLDNNASFGDAGDLYPGTTVNTVFGDASNPNSRDNAGASTHFAVTGITANATQATLNLDVPFAFFDVTSGPLLDTGFGQGVAWVDYDGDTDQDLFVTNFCVVGACLGNKLMRNDGGGIFTDASSGPLGAMTQSQGQAWGDYDNDGDLDLYVANYYQPNQLLRNDGGGSFTDVTAAPVGHNDAGNAGSWVDADGDGDLDLYVANGDGSANKLFRNGGAGTFTDAATGLLGYTGFSVSLAWADYDGDGDQDVFIGSGTGANRLLRNDGSLSFSDVTTPAMGSAFSTEGVAWADYDNDGDLDLYLAVRSGMAGDKLLRNDGAGVFTDVSAAPISDLEETFGVGWADYDNDGDLDVYVANGSGSNRLYRNDGGGVFADATDALLGDTGIGQGVAWGDYDDDGRQDLFLVNLGADHLFRNVSAPGNHWLQVVLVGTASNRSAIGARVRAVSGSLLQIRELSTGAGHWSQNALTAAFGLGSATTVDSLEVRWPNGNRQLLLGVPVDQKITVVEEVATSFVDIASGPLANSGNGHGVAWGDYDRDGDPDLYVSNFNQANKLLRNDGGGSFSDATTGPLGDTGGGTGVAWGDYDNDGRLDLYLANTFGPNKLFRNAGGGSFTDATSGPLGSPRNGAGVAWADYDNDGDLDLYLANTGQANQLFRNDGGGSFSDVTVGPLGDPGFSLGVAWADYDLDGDLDLYFSNYGQANKLLRNDGGGVFADATTGPLGDPGNGQGVAWGDYDNDGDPDLYLANDGQPNKLLRNDGGGTFADVTTGALADPGNSASVAWGDYDNDADLDLYVVNTGGPNRLLRNLGGGLYTDVASGALADAGNGIGAAWADFDLDGDLDLYLVNQFSPNRLLRNDAPPVRHWLTIHLIGAQANRSAIGARVRVSAGGVRQVREVSGGSGYLSQNGLPVHFGLGSAAVIDTLRIQWRGPAGTVQNFFQVAVDRYIGVVEGGILTGVGASSPPALVDLHPCVPNPLRSETAFRFNLAVAASVRFRVFDMAGRRVATLMEGARSAGAHQVIWRGLDNTGRPVPCGVYLVQLEAGSRRASQRLAVVR